MDILVSEMETTREVAALGTHEEELVAPRHAEMRSVWRHHQDETYTLPSTSRARQPKFRLMAHGTSLPSAVLDNAQLATELDVTSDWIESHCGVRSRHVAGAPETTASLGAAAAADVLSRLPGFVPDLLLCATFTPERRLCPTAPEIAARIGLRGIGAFDINAACAGGAVGLLTALAYLDSGLARRILLVCSDTVTKFLGPRDRSTRILMSDGAAALALEAGVGNCSTLLASVLRSDGALSRAFSVPIGGSESPHGTCHQDGDHLVLMNGPAMFRFATDAATGVLQGLCARAGVTGDEISWIVMHQANLRIIEAVQKRFVTPRDRWLVNIDRIGNTVSASIPFLLSQHAVAGRFESGDIVAIVGFGAGATAAGLLLQW
ncbi:MAG TPA: ketoacyl-ACP synthase III [Vicinamibacterales bacterium]|nr:ketoacyl-ACP synthase III [Vicinamibacterales bacterium]